MDVNAIRDSKVATIGIPVNENTNPTRVSIIVAMAADVNTE
jgi:hypothetical protein